MVRDPLKNMHRHGVLILLRRHADQALEAHEREMTATTINFVEETPSCFLRSHQSGHLTGSAWIVDASRTKVLLTHHRKLDQWMQLGGHADGDPDLWNVAQREASEESGLTRLKPLGTQIFDLDRHLIPAVGGVPQHHHYDLRFIFEADDRESFVVSSESKDLAWVPLQDVEKFTSEESILRMVRKTRAVLSQ